MSLFLVFSLPLLAISLGLVSWSKPKLSQYLIYTVLGFFGFLLSWVVNYTSISFYKIISTTRFFDHYTLLNELFYNWLLFLFPLLFIGFLFFSFSYGILKESNYKEVLYFWWLGFFICFSLYFLLLETNKYSFFEYIILPLILLSLFLTLLSFLKTFKNSNFPLKLAVLITLSFLFSLPQSFYNSLYFNSFLLASSLDLLLGVFSLFFLIKEKKD